MLCNGMNVAFNWEVALPFIPLLGTLLRGRGLCNCLVLYNCIFFALANVTIIVRLPSSSHSLCLWRHKHSSWAIINEPKFCKHHTQGNHNVLLHPLLLCPSPAPFLLLTECERSQVASSTLGKYICWDFVLASAIVARTTYTRGCVDAEGHKQR